MATETPTETPESSPLKVYALVFFGTLVLAFVLFSYFVPSNHNTFILDNKTTNILNDSSTPLLNHTVKQLIDVGYLIPACHKYNVTKLPGNGTNLSIDCMRYCYIINDSVNV